jgi:hypothetical protein
MHDTLIDLMQQIADESGVEVEPELPAGLPPGRTLSELARRIGIRPAEMGGFKKVMNREVRVGHVLRDQAGLYTLASDGIAPDVRLALRNMYS